MNIETLASNMSSMNPSIYEAKSMPQAPPLTIKPKTKTKMVGGVPVTQSKKVKASMTN